MVLIERYLHEVGKNLPRKNREDILAEIRSHLEDTLDERTGGKPTDADVVALLKETGSPQDLAASYSGQGQFLVGPALYPLWRMVTGIVIAAVLGSQLLAWGISVWVAGDALNVVEVLGGLLTSVPTSVGMVTIVFMILQAQGVKANPNEEWDPNNLPEIKNDEEVKRGELIAGVVFSSLFLALFAVMPEKIGVYNFSNGDFFPNPVFLQFLPWIILSQLVNLGLNIYLLWQGRWNVAARATQIGSNLLSIVVLALLFKGHTAWLIANDSPGFFISIERLSGSIWDNMQLIGMEAFRLAFGIALVVTVIETISILVRMIVRSLRGKPLAYTIEK